MKSFVQRVRDSSVKHPTQKGFSLEKWKQEFNKLTTPSESDHRLYESGVWAFEQFEQIRRNLKNFDRVNLAPEDKLKVVVAVPNRDCYHIALETLSGARPAEYLVEQTLQMKVKGNEHGLAAANPDSAVTAFVDGARFPLIEALSNVDKQRAETTTYSDRDVIDQARAKNMFGQLYVYLHGIWMQCLWNGWSVEETAHGYLMSPPDDGTAGEHAVSDYRRRAISAEGTLSAFDMWRDGLDEVERQRIVSRIPLVTIKGSGKKRSFRVQPSTHQGNVPPTVYTNRFKIESDFYRPMLDLPLPKFPKLTLNVLLDSWEVLASLAAAMRGAFPDDTKYSTVSNLLRYTPTIYADQVVALLTQWLKIGSAEAREVISFFTFDPRPNCELWAKPIIKFSKDSLTVLLAPLLQGNMQRTFDLWMRETGFNLTEKGFMFEDYAREALKQSIHESVKLDDAGMLNEGFFLKDESLDEEIDLLLWVKNVILIGEAKCQLFPSEPIEYHNYFKTLDDAAVQLQRKFDAVKRNKEAVLKELGLLGKIGVEQAQFVPFILTNHPLGVGHPMKGIPIIDLHALRQFLLEGEWHPLTIRSDRGSTAVGTQSLYANEEQAAQKLESFLTNPPQVDYYRHHLRSKRIPYSFLPLKGKGFARIEHEVVLPLAPIRV